MLENFSPFITAFWKTGDEARLSLWDTRKTLKHTEEWCFLLHADCVVRVVCVREPDPVHVACYSLPLTGISRQYKYCFSGRGCLSNFPSREYSWAYFEDLHLLLSKWPARWQCPQIKGNKQGSWSNRIEVIGMKFLCYVCNHL